MPAETVKIDRSTRWGNPFVVGEHGDVAKCVRLYRALASGYYTISLNNMDAQRDALKALKDAKRLLAGKNVACWCGLDQLCHGDVLLDLANGRDPLERRVAEEPRRIAP